MISSDWKYVGEGGKHAIFFHHGNAKRSCCSSKNKNTDEEEDDNDDADETCDDNPWRWRLLRLRKSDLAKSSSMIQHPLATASTKTTVSHDDVKNNNNNNNDDDGNVVSNNGTCNDSDDFYIRNVVRPLLHPYVDEPNVVSLPWCFVHELREQALPHILPSRLDDWHNTSSHHHYPTTMLVTAFILLDYRVLHLPHHIHYCTFTNNNHHHSNATTKCQNNTTTTQIPPLPSSCSNNYYKHSFLSVELKPKAGYRAFSPLVDPDRRIKFLRSRFSILQSVKSTKMKKHDNHHNNSNNNVATPTTATTAASSYDPLDLFSQDESKLRKALHNLWKCPQNNLRVWMNGDTVVMGESVSTDMDSIDQFFAVDSIVMVPNNGGKDYPNDGENCDCTKNNNNDDDNRESINTSTITTLLRQQDEEMQNIILIHVLTAILLKEPLLSKLLQLQMLDVLDADGAILVYQHLLQVCGCSQQDLEARIDATLTWQQQQLQPQVPPPLPLKGQDSNNHTLEKKPLHSLLQASPFPMPNDDDDDDNNALSLLCDHIQSFSKRLHSLHEGGDERPPPESFIDDARQVALDLIQHKLSVDSLIFLLQNWLLSLAMCDASFFITLRRVSLADVTDNYTAGVERGRPSSQLPLDAPLSINNDNNNYSNNSATKGDGIWMIQQTCGPDTPVVLFRFPKSTTHAPAPPATTTTPAYTSPLTTSSTTSCGKVAPDAAFLYTIKMIDCDQKPSRKLRTRIDKELVFHTSG